MSTFEEDLDLGDELAWTPIRLVPPDPWVGHIPFAFWLIKALRPDTLVELGTHSGNSYFAFCQALAVLHPAARSFAVDTWTGDDHAGRYGEDVFADVSGFNATHFRQSSTLLRSTFDEAREYFSQGAVDLLHIDGMHRYEDVRHDYENWLPTLSSRGVVLFHDTNVRERGFGVWRLWQELRETAPSFEFSHSNGLGVLGVGVDQSRLRGLFSLEPDGARATSLRRRVAARGEAFQRQVELQGVRARVEDGGRVRSELEEQRRETEQQRRETEWRDMLLRARDEAAGAREALIGELRHVVAAHLASMAAREALMKERDATIVARDVSLASQGAMLEHREAELARMQEHFRGLEAHAAEERRRYEAGMAALHAEIAAERQAAAVRQAGLEQQLARRPVRRLLRVGARLLRTGSPFHVAGPGAPAALLAAAPPLALPAPEVAAPGAAPDAPEAPPLKAAMRTMMRAQLEAFLSSSAPMRLPQTAAGETPEVSIVIVLYNQAELTFACLSSIVATLGVGGPSVEVVIVDNASSDDTGALLDRLEGAVILRNRANLHFLKAVNQAGRRIRGETLLLLNSDAQLLPGAVASALATLRSGVDIGAVGGRIILPDGTLQEAGSIVWQDGACSGYGRGQDPASADFMFQRDVDYCSGAFLLTPVAQWHELGGFDERFAPAYYEETDYCLRLWQSGKRVVFDPDAAVLHYEFGSAGKASEALALQAANHKVFAALHADWLAGQFPASALNVLPARTARSSARRVLVLEDRVPKVELGTGYPRSNRLVHELVEAGLEVAFFPMYRHPETWRSVRRALDKRVEVLIHADGTQIGAYLTARRDHFDAILVCRPQNMGVFQSAIGAHRELIGKAAVLYDAEALFVTRDLQRMQAAGQPVSAEERHAMVAYEVSLTRLADAVVSVSPGEQATFEDYGVERVFQLSHALADEPLPGGLEARDQLVFLGAIQEDAAPNADAVRWFATEILPRVRTLLGQDLRLQVVGKVEAPSVRALGGDMLELVGMVDELAPALARARVLVIPSRLGAGIPLKAYQAAMLGIPMVATELIARQLGWEAGTDLLVADDAAGFAEAVGRLFRDRELWQTVRDNALAQARIACSPERFAAGVREMVAAVPLVHRQPPMVVPPPAPKPVEEVEPPTSRPAEVDYSAAVPFGFAPLGGPPPRLAVICHLFYPELAAEIRYYLRQLPCPADLFISTDTAEKRDRLGAVFADWSGGSLELRVFPNRGRDIAPKLVGFADVYAGYGLVLHLHSKKSDHSSFLKPWRPFLLETLLGSPAVAGSILDAFARMPDLGMVAPQHFEAIRPWLGWNGNFVQAAGLAKRMGLTLTPHRALDFPSGSMFWARPAALRPLLDLNLAFEDFPVEDGQTDHTPAHAIERLYFYSCERSGHTWMKVAQAALNRDVSTIVEIPTAASLSQFVAVHGVMLSGPHEIAVRPEPAPMMTRVTPGLARRIAARAM